MPVLTDRQRIELAIPAYLVYAIASAPGAFVPADPALVARAEADVTALCEKLQTACLEPFADLVPSRQQALMRRLERIKLLATAGWHERPALSVMLMLWCFLKDLTDREILVLWEGSAMDRAMRVLLPMFEHGFREHGGEEVAREQASGLLACLRAEGLYR